MEIGAWGKTADLQRTDQSKIFPMYDKYVPVRKEKEMHHLLWDLQFVQGMTERKNGSRSNQRYQHGNDGI